jgi:hypothetical protein
VTKASAVFSGKSASVHLLMLAVPAAMLVGLYGRFKGIGTWPLGVDEFYISRSIDHILMTGLPGFPCGGYYTRGLLFQYLVAALRMSGPSPEFAGRFVAGMSSLAVLPAAYLLGKRVQGSLTGWLTVIVLLVSIWEIEMARFGRMYAPFQAVFVCYLVFYLRYTIDRDAAALRWMIGLSIVGVLTWEGGTLLGVANIFAVMQSHDRGRLRAGDWRRLAGLCVLLALLYLASRDLRDVADSAATGAAGPAGAPNRLQILIAWMSAVRLHPVWILAFLAPLGLAVTSVRFIWSHRSRWMVFAGLWIVLLAALAHAFTAAAGVLALMLLTDLINWRELTSRPGRRFLLALLALLLFWLAYDQLSGGRSLEALFGFPDIYQRIGRPWGRTMPVLTLVILLGVAFWSSRSVIDPAKTPASVGSLLALLFLLVLVVGAIPTNRIETRYTFFLYPMLIVIAVSAILEIALHCDVRRRASKLLLAGVPLLCFALTEDFQIKQVAHIDSAATNFRLGMSPARADHYYPRNDMRGVAEWLSAHVQSGDVVVSGIPNLDEYYGGFEYFYLDEEDNRYDAYVCRDGRTERWTNHPVLYTVNALTSVVDSGHRLYGSLYGDVEERLRRDAQARGWSVTRVYTAADGKTDVVSIVSRVQASRTN